MQETRVRSLGWEDSLEKEMATHSSILAWKISEGSSPWGRKESGMTERLTHTVGRNVNWYSHYGEQYEGSLKN